MNKKGFQLAVNFLVVIILSLVLFGAGMTIFTRLINVSDGMENEMATETERLLNLAMDDGSLIVISKSHITVQRGDPAIFSVGFWNELPTTPNQAFTVLVTRKGTNNLLPQAKMITSTFTLKPNDRRTFLIIIKVPKTTGRGQYAFDVEILYTNPGFVPQTYDKIKRIYVSVV